MYIDQATICSARGNDKAGMQVLHLLQTQFNRPVRSLCAAHEKLEEGAVLFLTTSEGVTLRSRLLRCLPPDPEENTRLWVERTEVIRRHPWAQAASYIVCINPRVLTAGRFENGAHCRYDRLVIALSNFCTPPPTLRNALAVVSSRPRHVSDFH